MHLMMFLDESGKRVYTLKKIDPNSAPTTSAHPGSIIYLSSLSFIQ
jgi:H/ACA ribonucleoprotein complex subunit 3